jgi:deoxyribose-phosphate aldolase
MHQSSFNRMLVRNSAAAGSGNVEFSYTDISRMIDHSLLRPETTLEAFETGCRLAAIYQAGSVCIQPHYLARCADILQGSGVRASTVIGFPHGGHRTSVKVAEARQALADGGEELDLVCNISRVVSGDWDYVRSDLQAVIEVTHAADQKVKVIFENCYLTNAQKIRLCEICTELEADWVKTSTGYGSSGATLEDLQLMRMHAGPGVQVKAAGGVRDLDTLLRCRELGVTRIGASATQTMLDDCRRRLQLPPISFAATTPAPQGY